jgi:hypothetical protein
MLEQLVDLNRARELATRRRGLVADIFLYGLAVAAAVLIGWTMLRLDARSGELAAITRARFTPCPCLPAPAP